MLRHVARATRAAGAMPQSATLAICASWIQPRCFAFSAEEQRMSFRVKAEDVKMSKLAGGLYLRTTRRQETLLDGMGHKSIQNCVRSIILANKFAAQHRAEGDPEKIPWFYRLGFTPQLRKTSGELWVSLKVVALESPYVASEGPPGDRLRIGPTAEVEGVSTTIISSWSKRCKGQTSEPLLRCMGAANVSMAVKGLARARKNLSERKGVLRLFVCYPVFAEVRYGLAPSVVQRLDFEDIREGTLRLFVLPGFEGDVRVVTLVDELAAKEVLAQIHHELTGGTLQRKRLLEFLHAAAASPAAAKWPSSGEVSSGNFVESLLQRPEPEVHASIPEGALFPHQVATVAWMKRIERQGKQSLQVEPFHFAGTTLGSAYTMRLPLGGVVAHPPGSGKTRIVAALASERASLQHARPAAMELPAPGRRKAVAWSNAPRTVLREQSKRKTVKECV
ncbi:Putative SWI/SNF-related matrix-associated actin-dependent regulator of chromatin subfamily A member 3-like 3 [Durusdinium trenchii]|uniref:SWI/SNF-related matrix-associated actin-dependent regulator of chromatin subfamily A member 3-like 3 n=1 Tax=Durusdinium trenchii TaxID=1381693 RepID=A0ABP0NEC7_9DINO